MPVRERLRAWYIAGLRNASAHTAEQLTPAALVGKDRLLIEALVNQHATANASRPQNPPVAQTNRRIAHAEQILFLSALALLALCVLTLLMMLSEPWTGRDGVVVLTVGVIGAGLCWLAWFCKTQVQSPLAGLASAIRETRFTNVDGNQDEFFQLADALNAATASEQESLLKENAIFESANELVLCFDEELRFVSCNRTSQAFFQTTAQDLLGRHLIDLILPDDVDATCKYFESLQKGEHNKRFQSRVLVAGHGYDLDWSAEWSGTYKQFFATARDITPSRMLERMRREFISMLGHDIRIPLTSIICNLQTLVETDVAVAENAVPIQSSLRNAERLNLLIGELLDYESATDGRIKLTKAAIDVDDLIRESVNEVAGQARSKNISVEIQDGMPIPTVMADRTKLLRALTNVISNAIKFSPVGEKVLIERRKGGSSLEIRVRDKGPGIPLKYQDLIFERYERIALEGQPAVEGTGLGLAIAKSIVQSHGGMIGVESENTNGSTFWMSLPSHSSPGG